MITIVINYPAGCRVVRLTLRQLSGLFSVCSEYQTSYFYNPAGLIIETLNMFLLTLFFHVMFYSKTITE